MEQTFRIDVNDTTYRIACDPECTLLDVLREELRLTGTKRGCDIGVCGSCTVLVDGRPKPSCRVRIREVATAQTGYEPPLTHPSPLRGEGRGEGTSGFSNPKITTIEGLSKDGGLHPIQQAFIDCGAIQCGFCTPGMVLAAKALLDQNPNPNREEIKMALAGNLCRCTGYQQIFEAIEEAARRLKGRT